MNAAKLKEAIAEWEAWSAQWRNAIYEFQTPHDERGNMGITRYEFRTAMVRIMKLIVEAIEAKE